MKLNFKSTPADFKLNIQSDLKILNGNILYLTREVDQIKIIVNKILNSDKLQKQVDAYFEETSPQTDTEEHE